MLVLTRSATQRIFIGPDIIVTVVKLEGSRVRLGIDAPDDVQIYREEIKPDEKQNPWRKR